MLKFQGTPGQWPAPSPPPRAQEQKVCPGNISGLAVCLAVLCREKSKGLVVDDVTAQLFLSLEIDDVTVQLSLSLEVDSHCPTLSEP